MSRISAFALSSSVPLLVLAADLWAEFTRASASASERNSLAALRNYTKPRRRPLMIVVEQLTVCTYVLSKLGQ